MTLRNAFEGKKYTIDSIDCKDIELVDFLFSLGCYSGEEIEVITRFNSGMIVLIKNAKYSIDNNLAKAIKVS